MNVHKVILTTNVYTINYNMLWGILSNYGNSSILKLSFEPSQIIIIVYNSLLININDTLNDTHCG